MSEKLEDKTEDKPASPRVEFRGRMVPDHYPARHAQAQSIAAYDDFSDGVTRDRIRYGDPKDRYPGGITYATAEERIAYRMDAYRKALDGSRHDLWILDHYGRHDLETIEKHFRDMVSREEIRTDHRCADCDVDVGEFHLPGCDTEVCPKCAGQAFACGCTHSDEDDE